MPCEVVLVRHATPFTPERGGPDDYHRSLTEGGFEQAAQLTDELVAMQPAAVMSSPYLRAVQTVEPTARALGMAVRTRRELREWDSGFEPVPTMCASMPRVGPIHSLPGRAERASSNCPTEQLRR